MYLSIEVWSSCSLPVLCEQIGIAPICVQLQASMGIITRVLYNCIIQVMK